MIILVVLILIALLVPVVLHAPLFKVKGDQLIKIKESGLIHFTNAANVSNIIQDGLKGQISHMGGIEKKLGELVWTYQYEDIQSINQMHEFVINKQRGREDKDRYNVCLKLTGFNDEDLKKMYTRIGFNGDKAIVYKGEILKPEKIEIIKRW